MCEHVCVSVRMCMHALTGVGVCGCLCLSVCVAWQSGERVATVLYMLWQSKWTTLLDVSYGRDRQLCPIWQKKWATVFYVSYDRANGPLSCQCVMTERMGHCVLHALIIMTERMGHSVLHALIIMTERIGHSVLHALIIMTE